MISVASHRAQESCHLSGRCRTTQSLSRAHHLLPEARRIKVVFRLLLRNHLLSVLVMRRLRTWMEAGLSLVCRKAYLCRVTLVLGSSSMSQKLNTALYISIATTLLIDMTTSGHFTDTRGLTGYDPLTAATTRMWCCTPSKMLIGAQEARAND